jgi:hypothetical protein
MSRQVYFHYSQLEEHQAGMWRMVPVDEREGFIQAAADLMKKPDAFREAMLRAMDEWPNSMLAAMTTPSLNRRAFMGHSGCCIAVGSSEDLTRLGWHRLTEQEQDAANAAADEVIAAWEASQAKGLWDA